MVPNPPPPEQHLASTLITQQKWGVPMDMCSPVTTIQVVRSLTRLLDIPNIVILIFSLSYFKIKVVVYKFFMMTLSGLISL
ncbi:hypothetical protein Patl1_23193 [Pistacia atlantica]|uniref:Uncharacterized protein n=1 Tax=Pistacia atlantica TaxID=434234 RepID=A0ACC0ZYH3_9ROSI|nr:hypothetical protein Patl1_23193 [Pistacia atlantica]